ncbi:hypothetical protein S40288_09079 [Stachybotrys chartarum IBT 40288]|nr:hypothetical protein S40288_09079 [Stachybotrys chartarum IBT 40288]
MDFYSLSPEEQEMWLEGPALEPPPGITPNLDNPPNGNALALAVISIMFGLASIGMLMRLFIRRKMLHITDYVAMFAFACYIGQTYLFYDMIHESGYFVHQWDIRLRDLEQHFFSVFLISVIYVACISAIKAAIILELIRIFGSKGRRDMFFWTSRIVLCADVCWGIVVIILNNTSVTPHRALWDPLIPYTENFNIAVSTTCTSALNLVFDLVIFFLPQKVIWALNMKTSKKLAVSVIFAIGLLAIAAACGSLYSLGLWNYCETTCGHLVFCTPALPKITSALQANPVVLTLRSWASASLKWMSRPSSLHSGGSSPKVSPNLIGYRDIDELAVRRYPSASVIKSSVVESGYDMNTRGV